jgi:hypothetical protein
MNQLLSFFKRPLFTVSGMSFSVGLVLIVVVLAYVFILRKR